METPVKQKKKMSLWKKIVIGIVGFFILIIVLSQLFPIDYYKEGLDYYNKQNYSKALYNFNNVNPDDKNYNDAIAKIKEIKPIVDQQKASEKAEKQNRKSNNKQQETQEPSQTQKTAVETETETTSYNKIGDQVEIGNFSYVVNTASFSKSVGDEFIKETADGVFLIVNVTFRNNDKEEHTLDNSFFKLTDENGTEFESSTDGETALEMSGKPTLFLKQCNPNITKKGFLIFEVPNKKVYDLHLSGGFWSGKTAVVKLTTK